MSVMELTSMEAPVATALLVCCAAWALAWSRMRRIPALVLFHVEKVTVNVPLAIASTFIQNVDHLPLYEQKVWASRTRAARPGQHADQQLYSLKGGWCGFPWEATFTMTRSQNGGFHSRVVDLEPGYRGVTASLLDITGGFALAATGPCETRVTHYERYVWPGGHPVLWSQSVRRGIARWHRRGMAVEMVAVKEAMELSGARALTGEERAHFERAHLTFGRFIVEEITGRLYKLPELPARLLAKRREL